MPVHYSEHSAGPSTRRSAGAEAIEYVTDYESMTKAELQALLGHMALPKTGSKAELIARLRASD